MMELMLMLVAVVIIVLVAIVWSIYNFIDMIKWDLRFHDVHKNGRNSKYAFLFKDEYLDLVEGKN